MINCVLLIIDMKIAKLLYNRKYQKGFTLIELLIVIAIIGILLAAAIVAVNPVKNINQAKDSNVKSDIAQLSHALQAYFTNNPGIYPPDLNTLVVNRDINPLPKQPDGTDYGYQRSSSCDSIGCASVLWGKLSNAPSGTIWCWDSTANNFKESPSSPQAGDATCP